MEITTIIGIVLLVLGIILVGLEMHIPGFGICGIGGIISLGLGIVLTANTIEQGIMLAIGIVVIIAVMFTIFIISMNSNKIKSPIVLKDELKGETQYIGSDDLEYLIGREGECVTDLRPMGTARFDGVELSVKSMGGKHVVHGSRVRVMDIADNKIIVEKV